MGVDDGANTILLRQFVNQLVNDDTCLRVKTGVRLIAEEVLGVHRNGTGNSDTLLHTAAYLAGHQIVRPLGDIYSLEAETSACLHLLAALVGEHLQRIEHIFQHAHGVEQSGALKQHAHLAAQHTHLLLLHVRQVAAVVLDTAGVNGVQADKRLHEYRLTRSGLSDNHIHLAVLHGGRHMVKHHRAIETLYYIDCFYHSWFLPIRVVT